MFGASTPHNSTATVEAFAAGLAPCVRNLGLIRAPGLPPRVWRGETQVARTGGGTVSQDTLIFPPGEPLVLDLEPRNILGSSGQATEREWRLVLLDVGNHESCDAALRPDDVHVTIVTLHQAREACPAASEWLYDTATDLLQRLAASVVPADGSPIDERLAQDTHRDIDALLGQLREAFPADEFAPRPIARRLSKMLGNGSPASTLRDGRWEELIAIPAPTRREERKRRLRMCRHLTVSDIVDQPARSDVQGALNVQLASDPEFAWMFEAESEDTPRLGEMAASLNQRRRPPRRLA